MADNALGDQTTRVDRFLIAFGACVALTAAAAFIGDGIAKAGPFVDNDQPNRWVIQETLSDGWIMFDTAKGRLCVVPDAQSIQPIRCTKSPELY